MHRLSGTAASFDPALLHGKGRGGEDRTALRRVAGASAAAGPLAEDSAGPGTMTAAIFRGRAPLRLGLAGGGTDMRAYCDRYGGAVLNVTINRFAHATVIPRQDGRVHFIADDLGESEETEAAPFLPCDEGLRLHRGLYNRIVQDYNGGRPLPLTLITSIDSPRGAGLGASSALVVAMLEAFRAWLGLPLGEYDLAHLAYRIERIDLGMAGGAQDQYAAAFGGLNFMEFAADGHVIVNPLPIREVVRNELETLLLLYFTGVSRYSSDIIEKQTAAISGDVPDAVEALHLMKRDALEMKAALLRSDLSSVAAILRHSWEAKKATAAMVSSAEIDRVLDAALAAGALAGKISGAGGGGFMMLLADPLHRAAVIETLRGFGGEAGPCSFSSGGSTGWMVSPGGFRPFGVKP